MSELTIELAGDRSGCRPGEELQGTVSWNMNQAPTSLELRLFCFTRGKGTEDTTIVDTIRFDCSSANESKLFRFQLPAAPYSFSGQLISLIWAVELVASPSKQVVRREIQVGPGGREVRLDKVTRPGIARQWFSVKPG